MWVAFFRLCGAITHGRRVGDVQERLAEQLLHQQQQLLLQEATTQFASCSKRY